MAHSQPTPACKDVIEDGGQASCSEKKEIDDKISDSDIRDIPKLLGPVDLKRFYFSSVFGLQRVEVKRIEYDTHHDGIEVTACRVLETWRKREASEATRGKILQALEESGCMEARGKLEEKWNMPGMLCYQKPLDPVPVEQICKEELVKFYKHEMSQVQLLPWCEDTRDMDDIYVSLELEEQRNRGTSKLEKNEDLVTLKKQQDMPATRVLVKGVAGSGKSTLLARLAYKWTQQSSDSPLAKFELLFIIILREVERNSNLIDVVFQQLLAHDTKVSKDDLHTYIESHSDRIIILLDGFDEYKAKDLSSDQIGINGILAFKLLRDCHVILSTRPYQHLCKHQSHYVSVKLIGFSPTNVQLYIRKFFNRDTDMVEGLSRRLRESEMLISLSIIPVMLMLMCLLWDDEQKLPNTQSELYHEFALYLWKKHCIKLGIRVSDVEGDCDIDREDFNSAIRRLGCVALAGLCPTENIHEEQLLFSERDFDESTDLFDTGCSIGLLTRERLRSRLNVHCAVQFLHKSFQEFCAATYWASLFAINPDKFYSILLQVNTWFSFKIKLEMLKFCCGLVNHIGAIAIMQHGLDVYEKDFPNASQLRVGHDTLQSLLNPLTESEKKQQDITPILTLLYESQFFPNEHSSIATKTQPECGFSKENTGFQPLPSVASLNETLESLFTGSELFVYRSSTRAMSMFHYFVKSAFGLSSLRVVKSVRFQSVDVPNNTLDLITDTLKRMSQVQKLIIAFDEFSTKIALFQPVHRIRHVRVAEPIGHISYIMTSHMQELKVISTSLKPDHIKVLCDFLPEASNLQLLNLSFNTVGEALLQTTKQFTTDKLHTLEFEDANLKEDQIEVLSNFLHKKATNLQVLNLSSNIVGNAIVQLTRQLTTDNLHTLKLGNANLKEDHIKIVIDFLPKVPNLQVLVLSHNTVGMAVVPLAQQLKYCTKLSRLALQATYLTDRGVNELANRFVLLPILTKLDISDNDIENTGVHAVFKNLHHLPKLNELGITARVDNQCSDLVKEYVTAMGVRIPETGFLVISNGAYTDPPYAPIDINIISKIGKNIVHENQDNE